MKLIVSVLLSLFAASANAGIVLSEPDLNDEASVEFTILIEWD